MNGQQMREGSLVDIPTSFALAEQLRSVSGGCYWGAELVFNRLALSSLMVQAGGAPYYVEGWCIVPGQIPEGYHYLTTASHGWVEMDGRIVDLDAAVEEHIAYFPSSIYAEIPGRLPYFYWSSDKKAEHRHHQARRRSIEYIHSLFPTPKDIQAIVFLSDKHIIPEYRVVV